MRLRLAKQWQANFITRKTLICNWYELYVLTNFFAKGYIHFRWFSHKSVCMFSGNFPLILQQKLEIQLNILKHLSSKNHQLSQTQLKQHTLLNPSRCKIVEDRISISLFLMLTIGKYPKMHVFLSIPPYNVGYSINKNSVFSVCLLLYDVHLIQLWILYHAWPGKPASA